MATLALAAAGAAAGSALLPTGISVLGMTVSGAALGTQIGSMAGSYIDNALFGSSGKSRVVEGPRLTDLVVTSSSEGVAIPRLYGRARIGGQVIWAKDIREEVVTQRSSTGSGKGLGGTSQPASTSIDYRYYATFAVGLCEGEISSLGRVWADGSELDLGNFTYRLYLGTEEQLPDTAVAAHEGAARAIAYRGLAYIVFEDMPLQRFGNRIPQLAFEVHRSVDDFCGRVPGVVITPGSGEFVYATKPVSNVKQPGITTAENVHTRQGACDWNVSLDQLEETLPNAKSASLVVSWFGTDLRAGECRLKPGVERSEKTTSPASWQVAGQTRQVAHTVSTKEGRPSYGGTPSDSSVVDAIRDLKSRGFTVTLTPFILMDIPEGNARPDPYSAAPSQPAYPWRGRITLSKAPGVPGSPDKTPAAASEIATFVGTATASNFSIVESDVVYAGPDEWSFRRMVLHYAFLAKAAGGVDAFVIASELRGLTTLRSAAGTYPFVAALATLADDVKTILGSSTKITYAADWSEYFGHHPQDGSGDVDFHLDALWALPAIDAIGLDLYWPLADWRDGDTHADIVSGTRSTYDLAYLVANVTAGEGSTWYYASSSDRANQVRTPITDGLGKPWVFRFKDIKSWWSNVHQNRIGGIEQATPTAWVPQSKPFWIMEIGCPAVDKGANQPNVFVDPKSAESGLPYFSRGTRDDLIQRRYLRAVIEAFDPDGEYYVAGTNPVSTVTGQRMVDLSKIHVYTWDARPFPAFPDKTDVWSDGVNWQLGHWINGRLAAAPLPEVVGAILSDGGFQAADTSGLHGIVPGFVIDRLMSAREALQPLEHAFFFDSIESSGHIAFRHRGAETPRLLLADEDLVEEKAEAPLVTVTRTQETDLPHSAKITFITTGSGYRRGVAEARKLAGASHRVSQAELPIVLEADQAIAAAEIWLHEAWSTRERARFSLPPSHLGIEPGDIVSLERAEGSRLLRVTEVSDHFAREIEALSIDPEIYSSVPARDRAATTSDDVLIGKPLVAFLDLPRLRGDEPEAAGYVAVFQQPWPGSVAILSSPETTGYETRTLAVAPSIMGQTLTPLLRGTPSIPNTGARLRVGLYAGELASVSRLQMLNGRNLAAIETGTATWEIIQFESATLVGPMTYELAGLLRGQAGTDDAIVDILPIGATFVLLTGEVTRIDISATEINAPLNWKIGPQSRAISDASFFDATHAFQGLGGRPLSPVHIKGKRGGDGAVTITWIRRTRTGGDSWDGIDVPLGEESESYLVEVLSGTLVKRTWQVSTSAVVYSAADQTTDFGSPPSSITVRVAQVNPIFGRGASGQTIL